MSRLTILTIVLAVWLVAAFVGAVLVGKVIALGMRDDDEPGERQNRIGANAG
jgi:hypothetical protein